MAALARDPRRGQQSRIEQGILVYEPSSAAGWSCRGFRQPPTKLSGGHVVEYQYRHQGHHRSHEDGEPDDERVVAANDDWHGDAPFAPRVPAC